MEEEKRIPSLLMNILVTQVDEMMGRRSLLTLLRQAELTAICRPHSPSG